MLEFCGEDIEDGVWPHVSAMADFCNGTTELSFSNTEENIAPEVHKLVDELFEAFRKHEDQLPENFFHGFESLGHLWDGRKRESLFVEQGIQSGILEAIEENTEWNEKLSEFVQSEKFVQQRPLLERYSNWSKNNLSANCHHLSKSNIGCDEPHIAMMKRITLGNSSDRRLGEGVLRLHKTFRRATFSTGIVCSFLGWSEDDFETEEIDVFAVFGQEGPQVFFVEEQLAKIFDAVQEDNQDILRGDYADDASLLELGVLVWLPKALS